ncbi:hypothetical protein ACFLZX_01595 [Nanoarchaeota archaeon]
MDLRKINLGMCMIILAFAVLALASSAEKCCINTHPNVSTSDICDEGLGQDLCCRANTVENGSTVYPTTVADCLANYYQECSNFAAECVEGCCCKNNVALPGEFPKIVCEDEKRKNGTFVQKVGSQTCDQACGAVNWTCGDGTCNMPDEDHETCPGDCPYSANCSTPTYQPKLSNLRVQPIQGSNTMKLSWVDECVTEIQFYEVTRCKDSDCLTLPPIVFNEFSDGNLEFGPRYTYKIFAKYGDARTATINGSNLLGNLECLNQRDTNNKFCISASYYDQPVIQTYFSRFGGDANETFYNTGFQCLSGNRLTKIRECAENTSCTAYGPDIECIIGGGACDFSDGNPFGMYFSREECEGPDDNRTFCFLDRSTTLIDTCYPCVTSMVCYDYKTEGACEQDNCRSGTNNCTWVDIIPRLGIGVCIDPGLDNCEYCAKKGSTWALNTDAFNSVFDICTSEKILALTNGTGCTCEPIGGRQECPPNHETRGKCHPGYQECLQGTHYNTWGPCTNVTYRDNFETCGNKDANGSLIDDNCNGIVDEGCAETECDGNDDNGNGDIDEGCDDCDGDNNETCWNTWPHPKPLCGADAIDLDDDNDGVLDINDSQKCTRPVGLCVVYNQTNAPNTPSKWGVAIDRDEDGYCLGWDCNDNNESSDPYNCTTQELCSNNYLDPGEDEVDCGGVCIKCRIKTMKVVVPKFNVSSKTKFDLKFSTDKAGTCKYSVGVDLLWGSKTSFDTTGGITHIAKDFTKISDQSTKKIFTACKDGVWDGEFNMSKWDFEISVDTTRPGWKPTNPEANPNPIVQILSGSDSPQTNLKVYSDDQTICRYGPQGGSFALLNGTFKGYENNSFKNFHQQTLVFSPFHRKKTYDYYVACKNPGDPEGNNTISFLFKVPIFVDLDQKIGFIEYTKKYFSGSANDQPIINFSVNKISECYWGEKSDDMLQAYGEYDFKKGPEYFYSHKYDKMINGTLLGEGSYTLYTVCYEGADSVNAIHNFAVDSSPPSKPIVDDSSKYANNSNITWVTDELRVKFKATDNISGIDYYTYWLTDSGNTVIVNKTNSTDHDSYFFVSGLNLTDKVKYYFHAEAYDLAGWKGDVGKSDGILVDTSKLPATCSDSRKNGDETGIDCGGSCKRCGTNVTCKVNTDCASQFCDTNKIPAVCAAARCDDGFHNGNETDKDCGGPCTNKCEVNKKCKKDADCVTNNCDVAVKICTGVDLCDNKYLDPGETDTDCGGDKCNPCEDDKLCQINADCGSGWCNPSFTCKTPTCTDGHKNGGEEATDCGGGVCVACNVTFSDADNDGISDSWEDRYCDGNCDPGGDEDGDGLTNLQEFLERTNPTNEDTDGDGFSDGDEVDAGTDPLDPDDHPSGATGFLLTFLLILAILALLFVGGYLFYTYYYLPNQKKKEGPVRPTQPMGPRQQARMPPRGMVQPVGRARVTPRALTKAKPGEKPSIRPIAPITPRPVSPEQQKRRDQIKELLEKRKKEREAARERVFNVFGMSKKPEVKAAPKPVVGKQAIAPKPATSKPAPAKPAPKKQAPKPRKKRKARKKVQKKTKSFEQLRDLSGKGSSLEKLSKIAKKK